MRELELKKTARRPQQYSDLAAAALLHSGRSHPTTPALHAPPTRQHYRPILRRPSPEAFVVCHWCSSSDENRVAGLSSPMSPMASELLKYASPYTHLARGISNINTGVL